jgi:alpha-tubulin suppressor-like RCC1 family protein
LSWANHETPVFVASIPGVSALAAGSRFTCALTESHVKCWGDGTYGTLGNGTWSNAPQPVQAQVDNVVALAARESHACAVDSAGGVWCWGRNETGQLGTGDRIQRNVPTRVLGVEEAIDVVTGTSASCALRRDGSVTCWGSTAAYLFDKEEHFPRGKPPALVLPLRTRAEPLLIERRRQAD